MNPKNKKIQKSEVTKEDLSLLGELENRIGIKFKNQVLLKNALIHKSHINEKKLNMILSNERLEFLGDAVLELIVSDYLFKRLKFEPEGKLTSLRAALVRTESLFETAKELQIGKYLFLSRGEENTGGRERSYILANTVEALIGAIYLEKGINTTKKFIFRFILPRLENIITHKLDVDAKSKLQEISQDLFKVAPKYELISSTGPDHNKTFIMEVHILDKVYERGEGNSKQEAEQEAARKTLEKLKSKQI